MVCAYIPPADYKLITKIYERAVQNGLPPVLQTPLWQLLQKHSSILRAGIGRDVPARVEPFVTELRPGASPYFCKARRYQFEQLLLKRPFVRELEEAQLIVKNYNSKWASPVVVVNKPQGGLCHFKKKWYTDWEGLNIGSN